MLRRTPLKRTGFRSKLPPSMPREERPARALPTIDPSRFRLPAPVTGMAEPVAKREYIRSKALREAYRLIPCQYCGRDDGTVCCAHSNWGIHGKGGAIKADDSRGASLCAACHVPLLDQGSHLSKAERQALWWGAHVKSIRLLTSLGHWPEGIPVPDTDTNPFAPC